MQARDAVFDDEEFMACFFGKMRRTSHDWPTKRSRLRLVVAMKTLCKLAAVDKRFRIYATAQLTLLLQEAQASIQRHTNLAKTHLNDHYEVKLNTIDCRFLPMTNFARSQNAAPSRVIVEMIYGFKHCPNEANSSPSILDQEISFFAPRSLSQLWTIVTKRSFVRQELQSSSWSNISDLFPRVIESSWYTHPYFTHGQSSRIPNLPYGGCYLPYTREEDVVTVAFGRRLRPSRSTQGRTCKYDYFVRPQVDDEPRPIDWHAIYLFRAMRDLNKLNMNLRIRQLFERRDDAIVKHFCKTGKRPIPKSETLHCYLPLLPFKEPLLGLPDETIADIFGLDTEETIRLVDVGCDFWTKRRNWMTAQEPELSVMLSSASEWEE